MRRIYAAHDKGKRLALFIQLAEALLGTRSSNVDSGCVFLIAKTAHIGQALGGEIGRIRGSCPRESRPSELEAPGKSDK